LNVAITGDSSQLDATLTSAEAKVRESAGRIAQDTNRADAATKKLSTSFKEATGNVTFFTRALGRLSAAAGAVVSSINAVGVAIEYIRGVFGDGGKAAQSFYASIGGPASGVEDAKKKISEIQDRIQQVGSEIARANEQPLLLFRGGRSRATMEGEFRELLSINRALAGQLEADETRRRERMKAADMAARTESALDAREFLFELEQERKRQERERAEEASARENEEHRERLERAQDIADTARGAIDPIGQAGVEHNRRLQELARAMAVARNAEERRLIEQATADEIDAFIRGMRRRSNEIGEAIASGITSALQQQANAAGVQNTTVLLSQIGLSVQAIRATIPRDFAGPLPGIPGGGGF